jgi:hypothetical protein
MFVTTNVNTDVSQHVGEQGEEDPPVNADRKVEESEISDTDQDLAESTGTTAVGKSQETSDSDPVTEMLPLEPVTSDDVAPVKDVSGDEAGCKVESNEESARDSGLVISEPHEVKQEEVSIILPPGDAGEDEGKGNKAESQDTPVTDQAPVVLPEVSEESVVAESALAEGDSAVAKEPVVTEELINTEKPVITGEPIITTEPEAAIELNIPPAEPEVDRILLVEAMKKLSAPPQVESGKAHLFPSAPNILPYIAAICLGIH